MGNTPEPITRKEQYLSYLSTGTGTIPEPVTREEKYLYYLCLNGGGGEGGTKDYDQLLHKPQINNVELTGDKSADALGLAEKDSTNSAIGFLVNNTVKNLIRINAKSITTKNVTITIKEDKTIVLNGTAAGDIYFTVANFTFKKDEEYILSGCPSDGSADTYFIYTDGDFNADVGNGRKIKYSSDTERNIRIAIQNGTVCDNVVFKPMLRPASIADDTYTPYRELMFRNSADIRSAKGTVLKIPTIKGNALISGTRGDEVIISGKNLLDIKAYINGTDRNGNVITTRVSGNSAYGRKSVSTDGFVAKYEVRTIPGVKYAISVNESAGTMMIYAYRDTLWGSRIGFGTHKIDFVADSNKCVIGFYGVGDKEEYEIKEPMVEVVTEEPYERGYYSPYFGEKTVVLASNHDIIQTNDGITCVLSENDVTVTYPTNEPAKELIDVTAEQHDTANLKSATGEVLSLLTVEGNMILSGEGEVTVCGKQLLDLAKMKEDSSSSKYFEVNLPAGTYTFSFKGESGKNIRVRAEGDDYQTAFIDWTEESEKTFTVESTLKKIRVNRGQAFDMAELECMLVFGDEVADYEPYVGYAPKLDGTKIVPCYAGTTNIFSATEITATYPTNTPASELTSELKKLDDSAQIRTAKGSFIHLDGTGESTALVSGLVRNLFNKSNIYGNYGLNYGNLDSNQNMNAYIIKVAKGEKYTIQKTTEDKTGFVGYFGTSSPQSGDALTGRNSLQNVSRLVTEATDDYMVIMLAKTSDIDSVMISKGEEEVPHVPHDGYEIVSCGKNLLNPRESSNETWSLNGDETVNSSASSDTRIWNYDNCDFYKTLPKGKYAINFVGNITNNGDAGYAVCKQSGGFFAKLFFNDVTDHSSIFTIEETTTIGIMAKLFTSSNVGIMLERIPDVAVESQYPHNYQPYTESRTAIAPSTKEPVMVKTFADCTNIFTEYGVPMTVTAPMNKPADIVMDELDKLDDGKQDILVKSVKGESVQITDSVSGNMLLNGWVKNTMNSELEAGQYDADSGNKTNGIDLYRSKDKINVKPNTKYVFSENGNPKDEVLFFYKQDGTYISAQGTKEVSGNGKFTTPSDCYLIAFRCYQADFVSDFSNVKIQLEEIPTGADESDYPHEYVPYEYDVVSCGEQLFDKNNPLGNFGINNNVVNETNNAKMFIIQVKIGEKYFISKESHDTCYAGYCDEIPYVGYVFDRNKRVGINYTTKKETIALGKFLWICIYNDDNINAVMVSKHDSTYQPYTESRTVITPDTAAPVILRSYDGQTNVTAPGEVDVTYSVNHSGSAILGMANKVKDVEIIEQSEQGIYDGRDLTVVFADEIKNFSDTWAWIKDRIQKANYTGIYVCDYIPITVGSETHKMQVAGIDTYYRTTDQNIGHHIDFISKDCYSQTVKWNTENDNNGNETDNCPYMVSNLKSFLDTLYNSLPQAVKNVIVDKRILMEKRYSAEGKLTDSAGWDWKSIGKLWAPVEYEVFGSVVWGTKGYSQGHAVQYKIFANSYKNRIKGSGTNGVRCAWRLATASSGNSTSACAVGNYGSASYDYASNELRVPLCFRIIG